MKTRIIAVTFILLMLSAPAFAKNHHADTVNNRHGDKYALGNMFTRALNNIEASGMLDLLDMKRHVPITDMHIDHGQVLVTLQEDTGPVTVVYDPIANKLLRQGPQTN